MTSRLADTTRKSAEASRQSWLSSFLRVCFACCALVLMITVTSPLAASVPLICAMRGVHVCDDAGRQLEVIDALGQSTQSVYDRSGRRIASIDALDRATQYVHDAAGRLVETILPGAEVDDGDDRGF